MPFTYSSANVKSVLTALVSAAMLKLVSMTLLGCSIILPCASTLDRMMASMVAGAMRAVLVDKRGALVPVGLRLHSEKSCELAREGCFSAQYVQFLATDILLGSVPVVPALAARPLVHCVVV